MKPKFNSSRIVIKDFSPSGESMSVLYGIYRDTIDSTLLFEEFTKLYHTKELLYIDFTLLTFENKRIGFSAAFFYSAKINGRSVNVARSATGLVKEFQGKGHHKVFDLYVKFIRFWLSHPFTKLYVAAYVINAFVFSEFCKFIPEFFPRPGVEVPEKIDKIMDELIAGSGHPRSLLNRYSVEVPIQVEFNEILLKRIFSSGNTNIRWYIKQNDFLNKFGLLVLIKVSPKNITGTLYNLFKYFYPRKIREIKMMLK